MCEMFNPIVCSEKSDWQSAMDEINWLFKMDVYKIYKIHFFKQKDLKPNGLSPFVFTFLYISTE
jgi:hypothetical protein